MAIRIEHQQVASFARQLANVPTELRRELRPALRSSGEKVAARVRANASWSSRIPAATKTKVSFSKSGGVMVFTDQKAAPHARPLEFGNAGMFNRHPVFGRDTWVDQPTRPFFMPAVAASEQDVVREIQNAIDKAFGRL